MEKVILIEPVLAHYRKDVFDYLTNQKEYEFEIIAGRNYQGIKSIEIEKKSLFNHKSFRIFNHTFYYLVGSVKYILKQKPNIIISTGVDFHLIHTLLIYFIHRIILRKKFYWWSHANIGNQGKFGFLIRKLVYSNSTGILSYNKEGKENLLQMGIDNRNICVVNNSLNKEDYGFLNHDIFNSKQNKCFTILYSGRVTNGKKVDILIRALGLIKKNNSFDFKCFIIGGGDLKPMNEITQQLNLKNNIDFVGEKYGSEVYPYFLDSDLFVYPGGIGLSIVHAMSFGIPVITTDNKMLHGPEFELLEPGFNGDLFIDNSYEDLANKIIQWEEILKESKYIYSENCIQRIKDFGYLPETMFNNVIDYLKSNA